MGRRDLTTVVRGEIPKLNKENVPNSDMNGYARSTLRAVERYFEIPGVKEDYEKWLVEYRKRQAAKSKAKI